jgi:hypothetical protein
MAARMVPGEQRQLERFARCWFARSPGLPASNFAEWPGALGPRQKIELEHHLGPERLRMLSAEPNSGGSLSVAVLVSEALNAMQE